MFANEWDVNGRMEKVLTIKMKYILHTNDGDTQITSY